MGREFNAPKNLNGIFFASALFMRNLRSFKCVTFFLFQSKTFPYSTESSELVIRIKLKNYFYIL